MESKPRPIRLARYARSGQVWTRSAVAASFVVCLAISWLNYSQDETMRRCRRVFSDIREARLDLARGYLHLSLSNDPLSPYSREEGLALLEQSVVALSELPERVVSMGKDRFDASGVMGDFDAKTRAFREQLAIYDRALPEARRGLDASLRLSYQELERLAQRLDVVGQDAHNALAARLQVQFSAALSAAVALLGVLCLWVYRLGRKQQAAARELLSSQDQFAKIVETVPGVIYAFELCPDGRMRVPFCTPAMEELWGVRPEVLREDFTPAFARIYADDAAHVQESILESARTLAPWRETFRVCHPQKGVLWLEGHSVPRREPDGGILWHGFVQDVTLRKKVEAALRDSEGRYRALVETSFDWVWEVDAEGRYTYVSPKVVDLLGYEPGEVLGKTPFELMPEEEAQRVGAIFSEVASRHEPFLALENINRHRSGRLVILETSGMPVFGADGQFAGYRGMDRDITARKQAEAGLRRSEAHLRTLVNTLPDMVWLKDPQGVYLSCNSRFEKLFGASASAIIGKSDYDFMSRELADFFRSNDAAAVAAGGPRMNEETVTFASDGHQEVLETIKTPMLDADGSFIGVLGVSRDITAHKQAEHALRQSEARRALALDAAKAGTWEWELATGLNTWSDELWSLYGLEARSCQASYEAWRSTVHSEDRARVEQRLKEVVERGEDVSLEWRVDAALGAPRWLMSRGRPMRDDSGRVTRYVGVVMDITARKRAELALETEAERLADVLDAQREIASAELAYPELIQLILARMSRLVNADGASLEVAESDEMVYEAVTGLAAPFVGLRLKIAGSLSGRCLAGGELMRSDDTEVDPRVDREACRRIGLRSMVLMPLRYDQHAFGVLKLVSSRGAAFSDDSERSLRLMGEFLGATISRKRTEALLREREERLQTLGDNIPGGAIYQLHAAQDGRRRYTYVSASIERVFGMPATHVLADPESFWALIVEEDRAAINAAQDRSLRDQTLFDCEFRQRTTHGEVKWLHAISRPRRVADGSTVWDGVLMDVTARKQAESERASLEAQLRQAQKLESVGRLAGGVAHDFNNLLMSIMGHAELCLDVLESGHPACPDLGEIMDAAQRSAGITRQLLAFARQQPVAPEVLDLNDHVANTLKMLRRLIGENNALVWRPGACSALVKMDPSQVDQILVNLAVNARDAIAGVGSITVETGDVVFDADSCPKQEGAAPGAYVMLAVSDTGCGMDAETLEHIFEPFFTTKPVGQGTGLGLATVYGIVKQNQGLLDVRSEPGRGTAFRIFLRRHEESQAQSVDPSLGERQAAPGGTETILLVEDEKAVRSVTVKFLQKLGYRVLAAGDPAEALRVMAEHTGAVHLLISDVVMPGMSGRELAERLVATNPDMKCLLISGYPDSAAAPQEAFLAGMHFLPKPFARSALALKVREVMGG